MNSTKKITLIIDTRLENVSLVGCAVKALCQQQGMDDMSCYQVQTSLVEGINNAIIHAYQYEPNREIRIDWEVLEENLCLKVTDWGKAMESLPPDREPSADAESGRGWWIMRRWMDKVDYVSDPNGNRLILLRRIHDRKS